jgi:SAM-dependent methyltransferase
VSDPAPRLERALHPSAVELLQSPLFRREFTPTWISLAALLAGQPPLDPGRPIRIADLGCRTGVTAAVVAACHPDAEVWALDDDPADIEQAQHLAGAARLDNLTVIERRTGRQGDVRLPAVVDIVVLDDVISTVGAARRDELAEVIGRCVRPGGLVAVSYRSLSGWAEIMPLRRLALLVGGSRDRTDRNVRVLDALRRLRDGGASFIRDRSTVSLLVDALVDGRVPGVERMLLSEHLEPMSFDHVARWLRPTGTVFVGSLRLGDELTPDTPLGELVADTADRHLREALHDIATRPAYRLDLFRRGSSPLTMAERGARLRTLELVPLGGGLHATADERLDTGSTDADCESLLRALVDRALAHPRSAGWATSDPSERCRALNSALERLGGGGWKAVPAIGSATSTSGNDIDE